MMMDTVDAHVPPPETLVRDDPELAARARARLSKQSRLSRILSLPNFRHSASVTPRQYPESSRDGSPSSQESPYLAASQVPAVDITPINLDNSALAGEDTGIYTDRYEWAILYENQRGCVLSSWYSKWRI